MFGLFNPFTSPASLDATNKKIAHINDILKPLNQQYLISKLETRYQEFTSLLKNDNLGDQERKQIINQYHHFVCAAYICLTAPDDAERKIEYYLHRTPYYPVGINEEKSKQVPVKNPLAVASAVIGAALIIASVTLITLAVANPIIGISLLAVGITLLAPSLFVLLGKDSVDVTAKQDEEKKLLEEIADIGFAYKCKAPHEPGEDHPAPAL